MSRIFGIVGMQLWVGAKGKNMPYLSNRLSQTMEAFPWVRMVLFSELAGHGPVHARAEPCRPQRVDVLQDGERP